MMKERSFQDQHMPKSLHSVHEYVIEMKHFLEVWQFGFARGYL